MPGTSKIKNYRVSAYVNFLKRLISFNIKLIITHTYTHIHKHYCIC